MSLNFCKSLSVSSRKINIYIYIYTCVCVSQSVEGLQSRGFFSSALSYGDGAGTNLAREGLVLEGFCSNFPSWKKKVRKVPVWEGAELSQQESCPLKWVRKNHKRSPSRGDVNSCGISQLVCCFSGFEFTFSA